MKLEELVRHYELEQDRIRDEIETERFETRNESILNIILGHPLLFSSIAWIGAVYISANIGQDPNSSQGAKDAASFYSPLIADISGLGLFAVDDIKKGKKTTISTIAACASGSATGLITAYLLRSQELTYSMSPVSMGLFLGGLEGLLAKSALSLREENLARRKSIIVPHKRPWLDRLLFDFPILAGTTATIVGYKLFSSGTGPNTLEGRISGNSPVAYGVDTLLVGLGAEIGVQLFSKYFDDAQRKRIFHNVLASAYSVIGRHDAAIKSLEAVLELPLMPSQLAYAHYGIGRQYLKRKDYSRALAEFDAGLKISSPKKGIGWVQLLGNSSSERRRFEEVQESADVGELIREGMNYYSKGETLKADYCFAEALSLNSQNLFLHWIRADALGMNGNYEEEKFERDLFLNLIFSDPNLESKFRLQHDSRNEIAFYRDSQFPAFSIVLKRSQDRESIDIEHRASLYFAEALQDKAIRPLDVREHKGLHYSIMPHAGLRLHEEVLKGNYSIDDFKETIDILINYFVNAEIAAKKGMIGVSDVIDAEFYTTIDGREIPNRIGGTLYFSNRIDDVALGYLERDIMMPERVIKLIQNNCRVLNKRLSPLERVVSKDANLKNFYRAPSGSLKAGDFESIKYVPVLCELSRLMEFGFEYLSSDEKEGLLEYFLGKWIRTTENRNPSKEERKEFRHNYEFASLYDNLVLLGYRARDALRATSSDERKEDYDEELFHLKSAGKHIQKILDLEHILEEKLSDEERKALTGLNEGIGALADIIESNFHAETIKTNPVKTRLVTYLAAAGIGILALASATFFGRQLFHKDYGREAIGISTSVKFPKEEDIIYVIDSRTGELVYDLHSPVNSFDWNPKTAQLTVSSGGKAFTHDLKSGKENKIGEGHTYELLLLGPGGNYMVLGKYNAIIIVDKHGNLVTEEDKSRSDIFGEYIEWAPNGSLLGLISYPWVNLETIELKGAVIKGKYMCPVTVGREFEFAPDSEKVAYVGREAHNYTLYISDFKFGTNEELVKGEHPISNLRWHDAALYFGRMGIHEIENGEIKTIISGKDVSFELSSDGNRILVNEYDKLYVKNLKTGEDALVDAPTEGIITNALFTPDDIGVFYTVQSKAGINAYLFQNGSKNLVLELCEDAQQCTIEKIK